MSKDNSKRLVKQSIYQHGGSRIWVEHSDGERELVADTYQDKAFAEAVKKLADEWYLPNKSLTVGGTPYRAGTGSALALAKQFHDIYERLAPEYGYETRPETRRFDADSPNGRLMVAVCQEIIEQNKH
jgi:hypothetical protein